MGVKALSELQPPLLLSRLNISWGHESYQDKQRRSMVQSYISKREVKTLEAVEETPGWRECGVWNVAPPRFKSLSQLFLSFSANGKKRKKSSLTWLNLTLRSFLGVCNPLRIGFPTKKSVSFTFPLGQTGQVKCVFFSSLAGRCCFCCKCRKPAHSGSFHAAPAMQLCWEISLLVYTIWCICCCCILKLHVHY